MIARNAGLPTFGTDASSGFYAGGLYVIRAGPADYRIDEVNGTFPSSNPPLVSVRCYALSPFASEPSTIYVGGYDANNIRCTDAAWIFNTTVANALR